ncbi:hypothetical protein N5079_19585 [Planotetraspora sp. A-T 1434]|uniref:hypothetical protein n=1 Tax=Planotetraspora sp. A-T 1434 TaxID=2979219 RepID=UPI0021C181C8|nr:hypothetical protein [Planotetraspora sp. A-T 1434]MCT9932406.1 hypothetical protein [Planotetraspora sp. A-T 1434]
MRPEAKVWRKTQRDALRGVSKGRRSTHQVETQEPVRGSSWTRRHPGETPPWMRRWLESAS